MDVKALAESYQKDTVAARRLLHACPEVGWQEVKTTEQIKKYLEEYGIPYICPLKTGAVAVIEGSRQGKTIGLCADIDALPIAEQTDAPYASKNEGFMHACGHDGHTAAMLTSARILWQLKDTFAGTIKIIFQPCEEYLPSGAQAMVKSGVLDDCDAFFKIHLNPGIPVGCMSIEPGPRMAASAGIDIRVIGRGGHGGSPHETVDATLVAASILQNLQTIASRELAMEDAAVISIGTLTSGSARNVISGEAKMSGTCRFYNPDQAEILREAITRIAQNTARALRAQAEVQVIPSGCGAVINDPELALIAKQSVISLWGETLIVRHPRSGGNEDFSNYSSIAPTMFAFVGICSGETTGYPLHSPFFNLDEKALTYAACLNVQFALDFLNKA